MKAVLENAAIRLTVDTAAGSKLRMFNKKTGQEHMWVNDTIGLPSILFPHCGKFLNDEYRFEGARYTMPQHGFLRFRDLNLLEEDAQRVVLGLDDDAETRVQYPFAFRFRVEYRLQEDHIEIVYHVTNPGDRALYYTLGCHQGYASPVDGSAAREGAYLEFDQPETVDAYTLTNEMIDGTKKPFLRGESRKPLAHLFDGGALALELSELRSRAVTIRCENSPYATRVEFPDAKNLVLWALEGTPDFVCIEPWQGMFQEVGHDGDLKTKRNVQVLQPGQSGRMTQRIYLI